MGDHGMSKLDTLAAAASALLKQAELSPAETARRFDAAVDAGRWRKLVPFAAVEEPAAAAESVRIGPDDVARATRRLAEDGYFCLEEAFESERIDRMRRIVEAVRADGWPAVFSFVFDDFWSIARSPRLLALLEASLGAGCLQNSVIWTHWVPGAKGATGWPPHVDLSGMGNKFLSIWISLSEAAIDNGCMFLIPPGDMPREVVEAIHAKADLSYASYSNLLHNVVALPVPVGSLIGWRGDVLHWGGTNAGGDVPRVSFALEFRSRDEAFTKFERPMIDLHTALPPLRLRLHAIAKALRHYPKFEPIVSRFQPLADRLWEETAPVP
jgi:hypothetical protein